jgi:hypothetical protein
VYWGWHKHTSTVPGAKPIELGFPVQKSAHWSWVNVLKVRFILDKLVAKVILWKKATLHTPGVITLNYNTFIFEFNL